MIDLIDLIERNQFLQKMFPNGFGDKVFFGQISLDVGGKISLGIHVKKEPAVNVEKWGVWGEDYNVVVVKLAGQAAGDFFVGDPQFLNYAEFSLKKDNEIYEINQIGCNFELKFSFKYLVFQGCDTYINVS